MTEPAATVRAETGLAPVDEQCAELANSYERELAAFVVENRSDLPTFYLGKLAEYEALRAKIKAQAALLLGHVAARERALQWVLGGKFREAVQEDLKAQGGKKKSVDYLTGTAGVRKQPPSLTIVDAEALKAWCLQNCEEALTLELHVTPIKKHIKETGEVPPGAHLRAGEEKFFPAIELPPIEGATNDDDTGKQD